MGNKTAPNVWVTADGATTFWWYPWGNRWQCQTTQAVRDYSTDLCRELAESARSEWEWTHLGGGQTTRINMTVRSESNVNEMYYEDADVTCEGPPAPSPTMFPTTPGSMPDGGNSGATRT